MPQSAEQRQQTKSAADLDTKRAQRQRRAFTAEVDKMLDQAVTVATRSPAKSNGRARTWAVSLKKTLKTQN